VNELIARDQSLTALYFDFLQLVITNQKFKKAPAAFYLIGFRSLRRQQLYPEIESRVLRARTPRLSAGSILRQFTGS